MANKLVFPRAKLKTLFFCFLSWLAYVLFFLFFEPRLGSVTISFSLIPVLVSAWLYGIAGGVLAGLAVLPFNLILISLFPGESVDLTQGAIRAALALLVGVGIGKLSNLSSELRQELQKRISLEEELEKEKVRAERESNQVVSHSENLEQVNKDLEETKKAMLNVLEDSKELQGQLETQAQELRKFKLATDNASEHIIITDPDGVILYANSSAERITGYSATEIIGKKPSLWGQQMSGDFYKKLWETIKTKKKPFVGKMVNKKKNGEKFIVQADINPLLGEDGEVKYFVAIENDITKETELTQDLQTQAQELRKFKQATDSAYEHIVITDAKGIILYANAGAVRNTGYSEKEMLGKTASLWGKQMEASYYQKMWKVLSVDRKPFVGEITNRRKNGEKYIAQINIAPILNEAGEIQFFISQENDITKERALEEKLQKEKANVEAKVVERTGQLAEEHARLQASINSLNVGFLMTDAASNLVTINSTAKRILCLTGETDNGGKILDPLSIKFECDLDDIQVALKDTFDLVANLKKSYKERRPIEVKDLLFQNRHLHLFIAPIVVFKEKSLEVIGTVVLIEDITEQKIMERSKDEFFSIASHELRTPLTAIRGNTSLINEMYASKLDKDVKSMVDDIYESSVRLINIVNDFLDTSRLEQGKIEFKADSFDFESIYNETMKEIGEIAKEKKLALKFEQSKEPIPTVYADKGRIKQVLTNLMGNAIKFTEKGSVTVRVDPGNDSLKISVTDTGRGIPEENQKLLFRKFQQAGSSLYTRDTTKGTGLGLYISKLIVEASGGQIFLEKSAAEKGSTFSFTVPYAKSSYIELKKTAKTKSVLLDTSL